MNAPRYKSLVITVILYSSLVLAAISGRCDAHNKTTTQGLYDPLESSPPTTPNER